MKAGWQCAVVVRVALRGMWRCGREGICAVYGPNGYDPHQQTTEYGPTNNGNVFPQPPHGHTPFVDQTTIISPPRPDRHPVPVPPPQRRNGEGAARMSLILGIISFIVGLIPVCGVAALLPAAGGILFGWIGLRSRQRNMAIVGILLSVLGIAAALALLA